MIIPDLKTTCSGVRNLNIFCEKRDIILGKILVLPDEVSSKIAAGEVIDGPYSIVRELMDNSLDADVEQIKITVNNGGKDFIQVADNGIGMSADDALLAVQKHTTSKIKDIEDLNTITTMGFRGEALSAYVPSARSLCLREGRMRIPE